MLCDDFLTCFTGNVDQIELKRIRGYSNKIFVFLQSNFLVKMKVFNAKFIQIAFSVSEPNFAPNYFYAISFI